MSDDQIAAIAAALGRIEGKQDALIRWTEAHEQRHERLDERVEQHAADINQAKGAKGALLWVSGIVAAVVSAAAGIAAKVFGTH